MAHQHNTWKPVKPEEPFVQMAIWQGTTVKESEHEDVANFFLTRLDSRIECIGCVTTSGGRHDFAFFVHSEDVPKFAIRRFAVMQGDTPRWWGDVFFNNQQAIYPADFLGAYPDPWSSPPPSGPPSSSSSSSSDDDY